MSNQNLQNNAEDEILSVEDIKIRQMIGGLKRVDAPKNFDFRLKARIAGTQSAAIQPRFFPVLRYVLPLSVVALVFTLVIMNGVYFGGGNQTAQNIEPKPVETKIILPSENKASLPDVAQSQPTPEPIPNFSDSEQPKISSGKVELIPEKDNRLVVIKSLKKPVVETLKKEADEGRESNDIASTGAKVFTPKGIPSGNPVISSPNIGNTGSIKVEEVLAQLGIETVMENGGQKVKAVKENSIGDISGVKVGDVIEAFGGEKLSGASINLKSTGVKSLTILRGTEKLELSLKH